ncbi:MAG: NtaA/DmoA family FMN-dependent monooxygenase [Microbacteriaceae bacterium]|nr:NtaA/DmoA family FMN-dependent monooxygenase [Microbacteriaceae bacterium]
MTRDRRQLKLGYSAWPYGRHISSWRLPGVPTDNEFNPRHYRASIQAAERGIFDIYFIGSQLSTGVEPVAPGEPVSDRQTWINETMIKPDGLTLAAYLAGVSDRIGIVATINSSYANPYDTAREAATIDHFSGGRFGINVVMGRSDAAARNYSMDQHLDNEQRFDRGVEWTEAIIELWGSWDPDWRIADKASGRFVDPTKVRRIDHKGRYFSIEGPSNVPASPQGRLPIIHAGTSERSFDYGAKYCDARYTPFDGDQKAYYDDQKARASAYGRDPDDYLMLPGVTFYPAETVAEAQAVFRRVQDAAFKPYDAKRVGVTIGVDVEGVDPGAKVGDVVDLAEIQIADRRGGNWEFHGAGLSLATGAQVIERAFHGYGTTDVTLADLDRFITNGPLLQPPVVGDATSIAEWVEEQFEERRLDGVVVMPPYMPWGLDAFVDIVVPELQRRGLTKTEYTTATLREHLGLPSPSEPPKPAGV